MTAILARLFSSVKGSKTYSVTSVAKHNSGGSILSIIKGSILLTRTTSRG